MPRRRSALLVSLVLIAAPLTLPTTASSAAPAPIDGGAAPITVMLQLPQEAAALTWARASKLKGTSRAAAARAGLQQRDRVDAAQRSVVRAIAASGTGAKVIYQTHAAYNGVAVLVRPDRAAALALLPGVLSAVRVQPQQASNAASDALVGAPEAWQSSGKTGKGVRVGIIDSGIDYLHADFGGNAAYAANDTTVATDTPGQFPGPKVAGGYDFAGDSYNGGNAPAPDADPMDCVGDTGGHGTHVAGTAGGFGVNSNGTTYTGSYDQQTPLSSMSIGPGVAPEAMLYALRVFGCGGGTTLVPSALDWAMDPNGDGDFTDHLDVVNLSIVAPYGTDADPGAVAADNAALVGVQVVGSVGNDFDVTYISGAIGGAKRAMSVASSVTSTDTYDAFEVTAPAGLAGTYAGVDNANWNWLGSPDRAGRLFYSSSNPTGCDAWSPDETAAISGQILLEDLGIDDVNPCDLSVRSTNAIAAGALGILVVWGGVLDTLPHIADKTALPMMIIPSDTADALKAQLTPGVLSAIQVRMSESLGGTKRIVDATKTDTVSDFSSRGPRGDDAVLKPDITAPGENIWSAKMGSGSAGLNEAGTSQAAPHVTGMMAVLKEAHPTWTVEQLKALAMNNAGHQLYVGKGQAGTEQAPPRVGAGRMDVLAALSTDVVAYADGGSGTVSVSFGALQLTDDYEGDRTIRVQNLGTSAATYTVGYAAALSLPGAAYTFPDGSTVSVPALGSTTFRVHLSVAAAALRNLRDPATTATAYDRLRQWIPEHTGIITLTPDTGTALRVPVYVTARPAATLASTGSIPLAAPSGTASVTFTGTGLNSGYGPTDYRSVVTSLELQGTSPPVTLPAGAPASAASADLRYVGVTTDSPSVVAKGLGVSDSTVYFGLAAYAPWVSPAPVQARFDVDIDVDQDGAYDYTVHNFGGDDAMLSLVEPYGTDEPLFNQYLNGVPPTVATGLFNTDVMVLPVSLSSLEGLQGTRLTYRVRTTARSLTGDDYQLDEAGPFTYDVARPGLRLNRTDKVGAQLVLAGPATPLSVAYNAAAYAANHDKGLLLLHHLNAAGTRAQVVPVVDKLAPTVRMLSPASTSLRSPVTASWSGADVNSGVKSYDVRYRRAPWNGPFGSYGYPAGWAGTAATSKSVTPVPGSTYCFSVRARDTVGNLSAWSADRCTAAPLDDRSLAATTGWTRAVAGAYYAGTISKATSAGQSLIRSGVQTKRISLVATTCGDCGSVGVYWNGTLVKTVSLHAAAAHFQQVIPVATFSGVGSGTVVVKTLGSGRVYVDGLALSRV